MRMRAAFYYTGMLALAVMVGYLVASWVIWALTEPYGAAPGPSQRDISDFVAEVTRYVRSQEA